MDILVRNINPKIIARIDKRCQELTTKTGKKWSRNKYLKVLIESDFDRQLMNYKKINSIYYSKNLLPFKQKIRTY